MPTKPPTIGQLMRTGRVQAKRVETRGTVAERGYGGHHRKWRAMILQRDPLCMWPGCHEPATVADHIVPLRQGGGWDLENGQGLCRRHHNVKTRQEGGMRGKASGSGRGDPRPRVRGI